MPEGYFDKLPHIIQAKIPPVKERRKSIIPGWTWQRGVALVSAMALIFVLVWVTVPERQGALGNEPLSDVSDGSIIQYLEDQNISYYDLSEHNVVQKAFETDSTVMFYLDNMDEDIIEQQILDAPVRGLDKI